MRFPMKALAVTALAVLLFSGCTSTEGTDGSASGRSEQSTMDITMQQAADRADDMLDATFRAIRPEVRWTHGATTKGSCDLSRRRVVMTVVSAERLGSLLGLVQRAWERSGYTITSVDKDEKFPGIFAESSDGFGISLTVGAERQVFFEVATPCVEPSDVAEPTTAPNGPAYDYPVPRPNVRSAFWSADGPVASGSPDGEE